MRFRNVVTGLLAVLLTVATLCVAAYAVEPSYKVSSAYKDTLYYHNLQAVELTGDGATDVITVALSQLGYHEGNNDAEKDGLNGSGSKNFVEYNVLFGKLDNGEGNGTSYGYAWCAAFVNWCLRQARVDKELTGGMYVSCASWRNWFIYEGKSAGAAYHARTDEYIPEKGDLIFYKSLTATHSRPTDHIGIVLKCEDGKVFTIEGNGDNRVALHEYALNDPYIVGYGSIAYKVADVPEVDYYRTENHLPGFFIAGKGILSVYNGPATSTGKIGTLPAGSVCRVTAVQGRYGYVELEEGKGGWVSIRRFTPMTTDPYYTVELNHADKTYTINVAAGSFCAIPDTGLLTEALGEMTDLVGWSSGAGGEIYEPGAIVAPKADLKLYAVYPGEEESTVSDQQTTVSEETDPQSEQDTSSEQPENSTEASKSGCNSTVSLAALVVAIAAGATVFCKKKV